MARVLHGISKGIRLYRENSDSEFVDQIFGSAAPGGDTGEQDDAPIGSIYIRQNGASSTLYQKQTDTDSASDWIENGSSNAVVGLWRPEKLRALTNDTVAAGSRDLSTSPFADDETPLLTAADFTVGDFIVQDADGSPSLMEVTAVSSPNVTFAAAANPLVPNDTFITDSYLPDSAGDQENQAIVNYTGSIMIKLGDIDWNFADGINMAAGYASQNGTVSSADTVNSAIEKLDGNQQDIQTASGLTQGDTSYGTFSGDIIPDNQNNKQALQALETALEAISAGETVEVTGITAETTVDEISADDFDECEWEVVAFEEATPANKKFFRINGFHNGTASADASNVKDTVKDNIKFGSFNLVRKVDLSGSGAAQKMRLRISSTTAGVTVKVRRTCV